MLSMRRREREESVCTYVCVRVSALWVWCAVSAWGNLVRCVSFTNIERELSVSVGYKNEGSMRGGVCNG